MENIKLYNELLEKQVTMEDFETILKLQNVFLKENNIEYYYNTTNLIIDMFINSNMLKDALDTAIDLYNKDNIKNYNSCYKTLLDKLVYIYITKQYYQRALSLLQTKKEYVDPKSEEEVNRLYLELAYVQEALSQKNTSLLLLQSILSNNPTPQMKALVLSNITKLYIDCGSIENAKTTLDECFALTKEIGDEEGMSYCNYLLGRIAQNEKNYKEAKKLFFDLIKDNDNNLVLFNENFNYFNQYILLLLEMNEIREVTLIIDSNIEKALSSDDLHNKLLFLKSCIKVDLLSNRRKKNIYSSNYILEQINELETIISENTNQKYTEIKEDELDYQKSSYEKLAYNKLLEDLKDIKFLNDDIRVLLIDYFKSLKQKVLFDEALVVLMNKELEIFIPNFLEENDNINTFTFKNDRLYEREKPFNSLYNTPIEEVLKTNSSNFTNLNKTPNEYNDMINGGLYKDRFNYMSCLPLINNNKIFGFISYFSKDNDLGNNYQKSMLVLSSKQFALNLFLCLTSQSLNFELNLYKTCNKNSNHGIFYYNINKNIYVLSEEAQKILNIKKKILSNDDYTKYVIRSDYKEFIKKNDYIDKKSSYKIQYHLDTKDGIIYAEEQASIYYHDTECYYCGTISKIEIENINSYSLVNDRLLGEDDFKSFLETNRNEKITFVLVKTHFVIFDELKEIIKSNVYSVNGMYIGVLTSCSEKEFSKSFTKTITKLKIDAPYSIIKYPDKLVRLDDLIGVGDYMLKGKGYVEFGNEIYASYISISSITHCLEKALISNSVAIDKYELYAQNSLIGYYLSPNIKGIYNNDSLTSLNDELVYRLWSNVISSVNDENIYLLKIRNSSLYRILSNNENDITSKKIIFDLDSDKYVNEILPLLSKTNCKLVINNASLSSISISNLSKYAKLIVGFNECVDSTLLDMFKMIEEDYYFYNEQGLVIGKLVNR